MNTLRCHQCSLGLCVDNYEPDEPFMSVAGSKLLLGLLVNYCEDDWCLGSTGQAHHGRSPAANPLQAFKTTREE